MPRKKRKKTADPPTAFVIGRTAWKRWVSNTVDLNVAVLRLAAVADQLIDLLTLKQRQSLAAKAAAETRKANAAAGEAGAGQGGAAGEGVDLAAPFPHLVDDESANGPTGHHANVPPRPGPKEGGQK